jgi:hypothetical protein
MPNQAQTFRIFVSSTFSDLKAERNALQAHVFPKLRQLCEEHHARFQPIDLRWGVSSEASLDQQAMNICLGEVARCQAVSPRPNFIVLLGDRYGWMPPPSQIPEEDYREILTMVSEQDTILLNAWYTLDKNAVPAEYRLNPRKKGGPYQDYEAWQPVEAELQRILSEAIDRLHWPEDKCLPYQTSATHQEILRGALKQTDAPEHVFCFFRNIQNFPRVFSAQVFKDLLINRLVLEYPNGMNAACTALIDTILALPLDASIETIREQIDHALVATTEASPEQDVLKFMRQVLVDITAKDYVNLIEDTWGVDEIAYSKLQSLKAELRTKFDANLYETPDVGWLANQTPAEGEPYRLITEDHIGDLPQDLADCKPFLVENYIPQNLCEALFRSLGRVILAEFDHPHRLPEKEQRVIHIRPDSALDAEGLAHHAFAEERLVYFVGREDILGEIKDYIQSRNRQLLVIGGAGGTGKSALLAKAIERTQESEPSAQLVYRFIGATPSSSDGRSLLRGLCQEISRRYGASEADIPFDFRDLVPELEKQLSRATSAKPLVLFLDSLDQLADTHGARALTWLPVELPENMAIVLSARVNEDVFENLQDKKTRMLTLEGLNKKDGVDLLGQWLKDAGRKLQAEQEQEVVEKFMASKGSPLYLKLAFEEARFWPSGNGKPPKKLEPGITGIVEQNLIPRLADEGNHGKAFLSHALGYLAASRYGLAEDELVDLLSRDIEVYETFFRQTYHLPADLVYLAIEFLQDHPEALENTSKSSFQDAERRAVAWLKQARTPPEPVMKFLADVLPRPDGPRLPIVLWSRLSFDLAPYLSERLVDGSALLSFYHRELKDVSQALFLGEEQAPRYHEKLAAYFQAKADPEGNRSWTGGHRHGLSELPFHLISAGNRAETFKLLTDFQFLEHKAEEVGITKQIGEHGLEEITSEGIQDLQKDLQLALDTFYGGSGSGVGGGPLIITARQYAQKLTIFCPVCINTSEITEAVLGEVINCPYEGCEANLKLNPFTIPMD